ncbi:hypothetical protein GBF38_002876 [Nibea albiflora]|uniref:Uncharacterized protein n=1 Tax=Nibea albiflora TaxID=240163 RepID=A0ACB7EFJ3_NIBAL|nr:hypothetical protein GBF38_002876 [Nibea albiflora]
MSPLCPPPAVCPAVVLEHVLMDPEFGCRPHAGVHRMGPDSSVFPVVCLDVLRVSSRRCRSQSVCVCAEDGQSGATQPLLTDKHPLSAGERPVREPAEAQLLEVYSDPDQSSRVQSQEGPQSPCFIDF